jgi:hypothetical protein
LRELPKLFKCGAHTLPALGELKAEIFFTLLSTYEDADELSIALDALGLTLRGA